MTQQMLKAPANRTSLPNSGQARDRSSAKVENDISAFVRRFKHKRKWHCGRNDTETEFYSRKCKSLRTAISLLLTPRGAN